MPASFALCATSSRCTRRRRNERSARRQADRLGFLPIMVMEHEKLIEKQARAAGSVR